MSRQVLELESILQLMLVEHRKLLKQVEAHAAAMKTLNVRAMEEAGHQQEAMRLRITALENQRRQIVAQLAKANQIQGGLTVSQVARLYPQNAPALLQLRGELKAVMTQVTNRLQIAGKIAGAVLGHLNTVVRLFAGAVEGAGLYTKRGVPKVASRIGAMNAVG